MGFFDGGYKKWAISYKNAVEKHQEAFQMACQLDDSGQSGSNAFNQWSREVKNWEEVKKSLEGSEPKHHKKYVDRRFKGLDGVC